MVIGANGYLEMVVMLISLGLEKYLLGQLMVLVGEFEGHSPNMDLRGYFS